MPRIRNAAGDETLPICNNCARALRYCDHNKEVKFRFDANHETQHKGNDDPRADLKQDQELGELFDHYIRHLANWYDLSDGNASFEKRVPLEALSRPLLYNAIIAFAAIHLSNTKSASFKPKAEAYHENCIKLLIKLNEHNIEAEDGFALAAVCLLRSYEILGEEFDPNRHLSGAFALAMSRSHHLRGISLARAGFFNFMREDITYSLINRCPLKLDTANLSLFEAVDDEDQLNVATLYLAKAINEAFRSSTSNDNLADILQEFERWRETLPIQFSPFFEHSPKSGRITFSTIRMLRDCHVATGQYSLVTLAVLTSAQVPSDERNAKLHSYAGRICGLAFTSNSPAVIVNSYGPISFSCRFLRGKPLQLELARRLYGCKKETGWPVQRIINDLEQCWNNSLLDASET